MRIYLLLVCSFLLKGNFAFSQEKEGLNNLNGPDTTIKEIILKAESKQDLEGKVWDMGKYYYCKFSRMDEQKAVLDGWILLTPQRMEQIKKRAAKEHNVIVQDIFIISGKENALYGTYDICAGGTKYTYVRRGDNDYIIYKKMK